MKDESARDQILARLRRAARPASPPPAWRSRRHFDDPIARFCEAATAAKGRVLLADHLEGALDRLDEVLEELGVQRAVVNDEPPLSGIDLQARWPRIEWHIVGQGEGELRAFCARADVGISGVAAALAETGSVVLESGPGRSRLATLLPPVHVALVPGSALTTDIFTWLGARKGEFPAALTLVSGPSKTADIEQTLAVGVHGPVQFIAILYRDD